MFDEYGWPTWKASSIAAVVVLAVLLFWRCATVIPPGYVGVEVVLGHLVERPLDEGLHFVVPWATVLRYPTRVLEYTMSIAPHEGQRRGNDSIDVLTKDGLTLSLDCTVLFRIDPQQAPALHKTIGPYYITRFVRPTVRTAIRDAAVKYAAVDIYSEARQHYVDQVTQSLAAAFKPRGIILERFMLRNVKLPQRVAQAIEEKLKAQQDAERMQYVLEQTRRQAEVNIVEAEGLAKAQRIINATLTPMYVQYKAIETLKELANSKNTTFVIVPTSPNGAGLPLIIGGK